MHSLEFRARIIIFVLALACVVDATPAHARTDFFDGDWSILIVTREGLCDASLRYGVKVADGAVINDGSAIATVQGRVSPRGTVRVLVRSGSQWANGDGQLGRNHGGGVWRGQGTSGTCAGTWVAGRQE
jgi:hypothetical protein